MSQTQDKVDDGRERGGEVVALVADLLFASRIRGAAAAVGASVQTVGNPGALKRIVAERRPRLVLIDLDARVGDAPGVIAELKEAASAEKPRVIAFGSHLDREVLLAARAAGADRVLARSAFVRELHAILGGMDIASPDET
jgi:CheY-like chemotaxis protein